jgi:dethiobiotin synthetase
MKAKSFFITGTDTGVGKTLASILLMRAFSKAGLAVYGMKPVASGCIQTSQGLVSEDALQLIKNSSMELPYALVNPVNLATPCSPNLAAKLENRQVCFDGMVQAYQQIIERPGIVVVEGVGGWRTPVCGLAGMEIMVKQLEIPVVLVVGMRLGCINHALLTVEALQRDNIVLAGWIANVCDHTYAYSEQTVSCLQDFMKCKLLGVIPHLHDSDVDLAGLCLDVSPLLQL